MLLITIPFSHYCEKARWALDYAGLDYEEEGHPPLLHYRATLPRGAGRTVPALVAEGKVYTDSTPIVELANALATRDRKLFPTDPVLRAEVLALEDELDRVLGPAVRRVAYYYLLREPALCRRLFRRNIAGVDRVLLPFTERLIMRGVERGLRVTPAGKERSLERTRTAFASVNARLADGRAFLVGDSFSAADLTFASLAALLLLPPESPAPLPAYDEAPAELKALIDEHRATPAGAFGLRMYRDHRAA